MNIQLPEPTFGTETYELRRNADNSITRIEGRVETDEPDHEYNIGFHLQVLANSQAQLEKLKAFELENPPVEIEEPQES